MSQTTLAEPKDNDDRTPYRVRHETKRRRFVVKEINKLTPHMTRVTLSPPSQQWAAPTEFSVD